MKVTALIALISGGNDGVHLAIGPRCGSLGGSFADVSAGVVLRNYRTIVAFGDSYTDGGKHDGSPLDPPVLVPPDVLAGGRSTNGLVWVEHLANDVSATIKDYAIAGACTDLSLWPSNPRKVDFLMESKYGSTPMLYASHNFRSRLVDTFLGQNNNLDPDTTLYAIFFGIK
ncbi:carbohydrate esterase family 16 protein [Pleurotus ostreatus PC15]|uniref:Carbohydrate esterase family 16 protein n=1 Tax=Pleurotus ostreatus (strain PC15) TaxID=1137138 RepID=A0A067NXI9_PLEO1|nr:carbohydrate esterase family 16 protein [Pleurotus ostreatus PC15]